MALGGFLGFEKIHLVEKSGGGGFSASSLKILPHTPYTYSDRIFCNIADKSSIGELNNDC